MQGENRLFISLAAKNGLINSVELSGMENEYFDIRADMYKKK